MVAAFVMKCYWLQVMFCPAAAALKYVRVVIMYFSHVMIVVDSSGSIIIVHVGFLKFFVCKTYTFLRRQTTVRFKSA